MIQISKGLEPLAWSAKKATPGFEEYAPIPELRDTLLEEQGYICAYCTRRIPVKDNNVDATSKIEHIKSREKRPDLALDYSNMAIRCPGNLNGEAHCDNLKGGDSVTFNLYDGSLQASIEYKTKDGTICSNNADWDEQFRTMLNLNHRFLKQNRVNALTGVITLLKRAKWKQADITKQIRSWKSVNSHGEITSFCGIVIWYLEKKLRQLAIPQPNRRK